MSQAVDEVVDRWVGDGKIIGAVVIVARDGEIVYRRADGFADREAGLPVSQNSNFRLASMTKVIVSATALALVDAGRLSLEDTVACRRPGRVPGRNSRRALCRPGRIARSGTGLQTA